MCFPQFSPILPGLQKCSKQAEKEKHITNGLDKYGFVISR
jgi:hypothetical protein